MADKVTFPLDRTKGLARGVVVIGGVLMILICGAASLYLLISCVVFPFRYVAGWELLFILLPACALAIWFTGFGALLLQQMFTTAAVNAEGVTLMRPLRKEKRYSWSDFQQVCICFASSVPRGPSTSVVCFVCHGEKKNLYDRWKTDMPWHYRRLIVADHTAEIEDAVRAVCPMEVQDLRGSIAYPYPDK
ncbi:MAG: hypothetical protein IJE07_08725 [Clostridia bacterium]|nr:hypothetical protein [Clostridia bacterium]